MPLRREVVASAWSAATPLQLAYAGSWALFVGDDAAAADLLGSAVAATRAAWVHEALGQLADDDDHHARLRDTLRVFLQENGSFKATAERLILHKNSVQYRVRKAEEALGHPVTDNRLDLELALLASQWLGATVLHRPGEPRP